MNTIINLIFIFLLSFFSTIFEDYSKSIYEDISIHFNNSINYGEIRNIPKENLIIKKKRVKFYNSYKFKK